MTYRRLTPQELDELRREMREAGEWMKRQMAKRRQSGQRPVSKSAR